MIKSQQLLRTIILTTASALMTLSLLTGQANAQATALIEPLNGVWIEGPGYDITYGRPYEVCAQRCLATQKCVMIEYYRPEKKCNLYDAIRPRKTGGSSVVGIRK